MASGSWMRRWMARFKSQAPNCGPEGCPAGGSQELHKLVQRQFRVPQNLPKQPPADHVMLRNGNRFPSGAGEADVTPALTHFLVTDFSQRLDNCPAGKNR